jgi:hypothetical protein
MTQDGGYIVQLHDIQLRINQLEKQVGSALRWRAEIITGEPLTPPR